MTAATGVLGRRRSRVIAVLLGVLAGTAGLGLAGHWLAEQGRAEPSARGPAFEGLGRDFARVATVRIEGPEGGYALQRTTGGGWVLPDRGGYPVNPEAVDRLASDLMALRLAARRTSDPSQYNRLGVGEPREGADGLRVTLLDARGLELSGAVIGRRGPWVYVRRPGDPTVYRATGGLAALEDPAAFADLPRPGVEPRDIASVEAAVDGQAYAIVRRPDGGFAPEGLPPGPTATAVALALADWRPADVAPRAERAPSRPPDGLHRTFLRGGQTVTVEVWRADDASGGGWAALSVTGELPGLSGGPRSGWLFRLRPADLSVWLTPAGALSGAGPQDDAVPVAGRSDPPLAGPVR